MPRTATRRITAAFERVRAEGSRALIAYLTAGDPSLEHSVELMQALERGGVDILELGVPFSDPIADGPVIQRATQRALEQGASLAAALEILKKFRRRSELPVIVFSYLNPVLRYGFERFAAKAAEAGADGALLIDLNIEAAGPYLREMEKHALDAVFLAAQTTSDERLRQISQFCRGFLYLVSTAGVTGERESLSQAVAPLIERARKATTLPLAVGFGLSRREHMEALAPHADGAIVGSAIMRTIEEHQDSPDLPRRLEALAADLKAGLKLPAEARKSL